MATTKKAQWQITLEAAAKEQAEKKAAEKAAALAAEAEANKPKIVVKGGSSLQFGRAGLFGRKF